jgi:RNA polymerase sigma-70 factor (ECF subfamily)
VPRRFETDAQDRLVSAIAAAKDGSRDAIVYLYCCYADMVHSYVRSIVADRHEADDLTHTVFEKAIARIADYEAGSVPFSHWLVGIARNAALDHVRQRRPTPVAEVDVRRDDRRSRRRAPGEGAV